MKNIKFISILILSLLITQACNKNLDPNRPTMAEDKRRKNIEEGKGASIGSILGSRGSTNYEFSTSNPMWRATLDTLDFLPLTTVDYSGGVVITDWYSESSSSEALKITVRFLSNDIRADGIKIIVHKKNCNQNLDCKVNILSNSKIKDELLSVILKKAALFEKSDKKKK
tara:strand:- start:708 stop:1217 length:510 start_codon:yes stop_codon:yes gene_type:complete